MACKRGKPWITLPYYLMLCIPNLRKLVHHAPLCGEILANQLNMFLVSAIQCPSQDLTPQTTSVVSTLKPSPSPKDDVHSKPSLLTTISPSNIEYFNEAVKDPLSSETKLMSHHSQVPPNNYGNTRTSSTLPLTVAGIVIGFIIMISFGGCFIFSLFIIKKKSTKNRASDTHSQSNENYTKG